MITLGSPCKRHEALVRVGVTQIAKQEVLPRVGMTRIGKQGVMARVGRTRIVMHGRLPRGKSALDRELAIVLVGKSPYEKRVLGFEDGKETSTPNKTVFVKSLGNKEASPVQTLRKKIDLGQCSHSAQVKVAPRRQPQAQPKRAP
ncbi:hypothetical protein LWI29_005348 [Acer saccharum]|uniref:Uncharacterized protein n=1 Tax=Acer saccharum TaxID=4024 RepID=A0AA39VXH7_ACESA|nr:hypothetical protein LWI29_005348 [Acer saccharum]